MYRAIKITLALGIAVASFFVGRATKGETITNNYYENTLTDWEVMELAIYKTESEFNTLAVGKSEDWGLAQITPIYIKEANRILGEERYIHQDAFCPIKTHELFTITQNYHNPTHDIERAIVLHNPTATSAYAIKVKKNMEWVRNYETIRRAVR